MQSIACLGVCGIVRVVLHMLVFGRVPGAVPGAVPFRVCGRIPGRVPGSVYRFFWEDIVIEAK